MTTQDLIDYYVNLLIAQYAMQSRAKATVAAFIAQALSDQIASQVRDGFNFNVLPVGAQPDSPQGAQMDTLAAYRGSQRVYYGLAPYTYFQMPDAVDPIVATANGFMDGPTPALVNWLFVTAEDTAKPIYTLTDDDLYRLTQLRAKVHSSRFGIGDIDAILEAFFGNNVSLIDVGNMTIYYVDLNSDHDTLFSIAAVSKSLPRPAGVQIKLFRADMLTNWFGLQDALTPTDSSFSGFSDALLALTTGTFISAP